MEEGLADLIEIPTGLARGRTLGGLPIFATVAVGVMIGGCWLATSSLWSLLVAVPAWLFFKWHARRDALFLETWSGQLTFKPYYYP